MRRIILLFILLILTITSCRMSEKSAINSDEMLYSMSDQNDTICFTKSKHTAFMDSIHSGRNEMIDAIEILLNQLEEIELKNNNMSISSEENNSDLLLAGDYYALIIAVEDYDNLKDLGNPINDAKRLKDVLVTNYTFKEKNIEILPNPVKARVSNVLDWYAAKENKEMVNSNLLIFYAGHGGYDDRLDDGYWCPSDGDPDKYSTMIRNSSIREYIQLIQARNILLISDACWAGSLMRSTDNINKIDKYQDIYNLKSRKYMSSGVMSEVPDKSTFLSHLVIKLKNNKDKYLSASKLFSRISEDVLFETPRTSGDNVIPQFSYIRGSGHEKGGDFFFIKK